jgi:hypothetical protein
MTTEAFNNQPDGQASQSEIQRAPSPEESGLEDLTLTELLGEIWRAPGVSLRALARVLTHNAKTVDVPAARTGLEPARATPPAVRREPPPTAEQQAALRTHALQLSLRIVALLVALYGSAILWSERTERSGLNVGAPFLLAAFVLWILAEPVNRRLFAGLPAEFVSHAGEAIPKTRARLFWLGGATIWAGLAAVLNAGNRFTLLGVIAWFLSIVLIVAAFAPPGWGWSAVRSSARAFRLRRGWTLWALAAIMILAGVFRLTVLNGTPPEMTSDHVEKILDAQNILNGITQVFFPNNGGRDPIQFYLMASLSQLPGLGPNFLTLKLLTAIEGLVSIPLLWWMGREMIGEQEPELGNLVGLLLAALVAVSSWHVMLSRLGLRIILTVIFTALLVIYLSRALRHNRRADFIKAGLALGFGLYAYQSIRMLPIVVVLGVGLAVLFSLLRRQAGRRVMIRLYLTNLVVLATVSFIIFVPMLTFSLEYPQDFWRRTSGRLVGDGLFQEVNAEGVLVVRRATLDEQWQAFQENIGKLFFNIRNALLMYNWKGDVAWITNAPNRPAMDQFTGSLLIVGLAAWTVRMVRRRDPADWLMIPMVFIMLLPSALSIAYPIENPSATRTSGTLPVVYLFAALPLAMIVLSLKRLFTGWQGRAAGTVAASVIILLSLSDNWTSYFGVYHDTYLHSSPAAYTEAGRYLRGFAESGGSYGNAYMIAYRYWWDSDAIGIEAGRPDWPNGIADPDGDNTGKDAVDAVPQFMYLASQKPLSDPYRLDSEKDLLFFYSTQDTTTEAKLREWFPEGYARWNSSYKPGGDFMTFRVPKLGFQRLVDFFVEMKVLK